MISSALLAFRAHADAPAHDVADVRLYNDFSLPLEPATLYSMSEYNLSLCLFESLFSLDDASLPRSDLLQSWRYDAKTKSYAFVIRSDAQWSDGAPFTADDVIVSLNRLQKVAPGHYTSVASLLSGDLKKISTKELQVPVKAPSDDLFKRLTAVFIPMVRSDLLNPVTQRVARHDVTLAPYIVDAEHTTKTSLRLTRNNRFRNNAKQMPRTIEMRPYSSPAVRAADAARRDAWPNLVLDRAFTTKAGWDAIKKAGASVWTRPVDRVLYLYPTRAGMQRGDLASVMRWLGTKLEEAPLPFDQYPGVKTARALQPPGFFLNETIVHAAGSAPKAGHTYKVAVINPQMPAEFLKAELAKRGLAISYAVFPVTKLADVQAAKDFDFILSAFGAADPDPVTWLSLVLDSKIDFIADYDGAYKKEFHAIKSDQVQQRRYARLKALISKAGAQGSYLPLAHFSSIAVGGAGIGLGRIRESDETVSLAKLVVTR